MTSEQAILAILTFVPGRTVRGKKRLQKLAHLWQASGMDIEANFKIRHYGPFSSEIENSCALLSILGDIEEKEVSTGYANYLTTEYSLPIDTLAIDVTVSEPQKKLLEELDHFGTIDLEVASTVVFFINTGLTLDDAINRTRLIKPTKVNAKTIENAKRIMAQLELNLLK